MCGFALALLAGAFAQPHDGSPHADFPPSRPGKSRTALDGVASLGSTAANAPQLVDHVREQWRRDYTMLMARATGLVTRMKALAWREACMQAHYFAKRSQHAARKQMLLAERLYL